MSEHRQYDTPRDIKPQYLSGFATLFWGFQNDLLWFALPMAIILETRYFLNRRWALQKSDFYRVADLTSVGLVGMVAFLFMNAREYHFITTLISWTPILLFPLVAVLAYSTTPRMSLDVLFYSLRRQREPVQQSWDMDYVFLGTCLLAAGLDRQGSYYFPIVSMIIIAALYQLRSPRFPKAAFLLSMALVFLSATALHHGLRETHLGIKKSTERWFADWISQRIDPMRARTALGHVGRLKLSDDIRFRIQPMSGSPDFPRLLAEAAYDSPSTNSWSVFDRSFPNTLPTADDFRWSLTDEPREAFAEAKIYIEFDREQSLIPVPPEVKEINELPATRLHQSVYGVFKGEGLIPAPHYRVRYGPTGHLGEPPSATDLEVPEDYQPVLASVTPGSLADQEAITWTQRFFKDFRYTLYQDNPDIKKNPLAYFLTESKAGHCEYFASATTLMLRQMGVPARYVVGYSIQEWNDRLAMYVVRQRHAHAWSVAWLDNRWVVVDTTPSQWLLMEEDRAGLMQPVWDFLGNNLFLFQIWWNEQSMEDYETELYVIGFILAVILIWRIATSEQVVMASATQADQQTWILPGAESPFFRIEALLAEQGYRRGRGELMSAWLLRIERPELLPLLASHNRWRFDPHGISMDERQQLASQVAEWLDGQQDPVSSPPG